MHFERNRNQYHDLLLRTSRTGDFEPWISVFLRAVRAQATDAEERTVRLVELHSTTRSPLLGERVSMTVVRATELLFSTPYVSATSLASALDGTFPTAQSAIDLLVSRGNLVEVTGRKRNRFYFAQSIFDAVYATPPEPAEQQPTLFEP